MQYGVRVYQRCVGRKPEPRLPARLFRHPLHVRQPLDARRHRQHPKGLRGLVRPPCPSARPARTTPCRGRWPGCASRPWPSCRPPGSRRPRRCSGSAAAPRSRRDRPIGRRLRRRGRDGLAAGRCGRRRREREQHESACAARAARRQAAAERVSGAGDHIDRPSVRLGPSRPRLCRRAADWPDGPATVRHRPPARGRSHRATLTDRPPAPGASLGGPCVERTFRDPHVAVHLR